MESAAKMYCTPSVSKERVINLEKEYSPSQNTKRFQEYPNPSEKVLENFIKVTKNDTDNAHSKYKILENVRYGREDINDRQILDIYFKEIEESTPIFVYIHGGFWQALDKSTSGSLVSPLVDKNHRVIVMDYNLCPSVSLKRLVEQTLDFFIWVFNYGASTKASYISFCGHSAGAHLAASLLYSNHLQKLSQTVKVHSFFLISGIYDLRELFLLDCVNANNILSLNLEEATALSPLCEDPKDATIEYCQNNNIKFHILVAENDSTTFIEQSRSFSKKLSQLGLSVEFKIFENYDHFDIIEEADTDGSPINHYIMEHSNCNHLGKI